MPMYNKQKGAGLVEVLVALFLLAVTVLGFVALQLRAFEATSEGVYRVQAMNLARDLAERIRANRLNYTVYRTQIETASNQKDPAKNCYTTLCTTAEMADFDVSQIRKKADSLGMTFNFLPCSGTTQRRCIYVAWNETSATNGTDTTACTNGNAYRNNSQCVVLETY